MTMTEVGGLYEVRAARRSQDEGLESQLRGVASSLPYQASLTAATRGSDKPMRLTAFHLVDRSQPSLAIL